MGRKRQCVRSNRHGGTKSEACGKEGEKDDMNEDEEGGKKGIQPPAAVWLPPNTSGRDYELSSSERSRHNNNDNYHDDNNNNNNDDDDDDDDGGGGGGGDAVENE